MGGGINKGFWVEYIPLVLGFYFLGGISGLGRGGVFLGGSATMIFSIKMRGICLP